jgi:hypothetical protein
MIWTVSIAVTRSATLPESWTKSDCEEDGAADRRLSLKPAGAVQAKARIGATSHSRQAAK